MQQRFIPVMAFIATVVLFVFPGAFLELTSIKTVVAQALSTPTPTPIVGTQSGVGSDTSILVAVIGVVGLAIAAIIAGVVAVYQMQRNARLEREKLEKQHQYELEILRLQKQYSAEEHERERIEREMAREHARREKELEQERQREQADKEKAHIIQTRDEYIQNYREALRNDPRIAYLQILDMSQPLDVMRVYVQLRVRSEALSSYELDSALVAAEAQRDPNVLLRSGRTLLENYFINALDPVEAIQEYRRCVIVGDPGAGKTTLLKYLALQSINNKLSQLPDLPIHIELNDFVSSNYSDLLDFAAIRWEEKYAFPKTDARIYIEESMKIGKALLLLDALDETVIGDTSNAADNSYNRIVNAILQVASRYPKSPIVVTVRKAGYQQHMPLAGFTELEMLDFRPKDIKEFVNNWFACHPDPKKRANADDLNARLERHIPIQSLAANPLLLTLIVIVYEAQLDLPDQRAELYKQCVETLLTKWDATRNVRRRREFKPEHKRQLLQQVAWYFHVQGRRYFPENELLTVIADFLPAIGLPPEQNALVLAEIASENGLLKEQARGWHGFLHLTLQEYFVAQFAAEQNQLEVLLEHLGDPWWEEVILMYAGCTPDGSSFLKRLLRKDDEKTLWEDIFYTNLLLAGRCLVARPTIRDVFLREEVISSLFAILKKAPFSLIKEQVSSTLAEIGGLKVEEQLLSILQDATLDNSVHISIVSSLGQLGDHAVVPKLLPLLQDDSLSIGVRQQIASALGQLGDRSVVPILLYLLDDARLDEYVASSIASALGQLGDHSIIPNLLSLLQDGRVDRFVRWNIANALGQLGDHTIVPGLLSLLQDASLDDSVRISIVSALSQLGGRSIVPNLLSLLQDTNLENSLCGSIAITLGQLGDRTIVPNLLSLLRNTSLDDSVRRRIADALGLLGDRSIIPDLLSMLQGTILDDSVRVSIACALVRLGDRSLVSSLLSLLEDASQDEWVGSYITAALSQLGDRSVVPKLLTMLQNNSLNQGVHVNIASTLGHLGDRSVVPKLLTLLQDASRDQVVRISIVSALALLGDDAVTARSLAKLLLESDIANSIYESLWSVSRRAKVLVFISNIEGNKQIQLHEID